MTDVEQMTNVSANTTKTGKDISQFVKYLLEGSGVSEDDIDVALLRQELEQLNTSNTFQSNDDNSIFSAHQSLIQKQKNLKSINESSSPAGEDDFILQESESIQSPVRQSESSAQANQSYSIVNNELNTLRKENERLNNELKKIHRKCNGLNMQLDQLKQEKASEELSQMEQDKTARSFINQILLHDASSYKKSVPIDKVQKIVKYYMSQLQDKSEFQQQDRSQLKNSNINYQDDEKLAVMEELTNAVEQLRQQLEEKDMELEEATKQIEIMKLQNISTQDIARSPSPQKPVFEDNLTKSKRQSLSLTRQLIKRDKMRYLKRKSMSDLNKKVDPPIPVVLPSLIDCREIIYDLCQALKVNDIKKLHNSLDSIVKSVELIPKMRTYIETINKIVWNDDQVHALSDTAQKMKSMLQLNLDDIHDVTETSIDQILKQVDDDQTGTGMQNEILID